MIRLRRRELLAGIGFALGAGFGALFRGTRRVMRRRPRLRPPGAATEDDFLASCIRCGQCVQACPFDTLRLTPPGPDAESATPFVDSRKTPCYLCEGYDELRCIAACPTDALRRVASVRDIRMGVAEINESTCLGYNGVTCRVCWHACPFPDEALRFDALLRPVVNPEACIGCGLCDYACPTEESSIPIRPAAAQEGTT
ncbi:MAG: 4Fe-4S dicluster domain-containing protein [Planctomycetota bacterium]|nr:MAG: 4Fe-4S dicluster domain-containing protein [Planctomycetota bacterium]